MQLNSVWKQNSVLCKDIGKTCNEVLFSFRQLGTSRAIWGEGSQWLCQIGLIRKPMTNWIGCWWCGRVQPILDSATPGQVIQVCISHQDEKLQKNKPVSRVPPCLCLQFLCPGSRGPDFPSQWPAMKTCKTQDFFLTLRWVMVFYHSHRKQARRMRQGCYHCQMLTFGESVRKTHRGEQRYWGYIFAQTITLKNERQNK